MRGTASLVVINIATKVMADPKKYFIMSPKQLYYLSERITLIISFKVA
jgi:hypothetical protein